MGHARIRGSRGWVTARGHPAHLAFMAGSGLPAMTGPVCENTPFQDVNPHILCSPDFGAFA